MKQKKLFDDPVYNTVPDEYIIYRIVTGRLHVCHQTLDVHSYHSGWKRWVKKVPRAHPVSGRLRFALKYRWFDARTIYRNKLVWLYFKRTLVPKGYDIHHIDENNTNDRIENLRLEKADYNRRLGYLDQESKCWRNSQDFFFYLEWFGRLPEEGSELWE